MAWRDRQIIPRYNASGTRKFAFHVPEGLPDAMEAGGQPVIDGPASFPTACFAIPNLTRDQIVYGDLIGMVLALATLYALRYRWRFAIPLAWVFVVATVIDLSNAAVMGIREDLFDKATDVSWLILTFYVPALWVSVVLVAWRLWTRRGERIASCRSSRA